MKSKIKLEKIYSDNDMVELKVEVADGESTFCNKVYVGYKDLEKFIENLNIFSKEITLHSLHDIKLGEFGPEYANGGLQARLEFKQLGTIYISTYQQSDFQVFKNISVASEAKMYLKTEPVLLDNFIAELKSLNSGTSQEALLECI